MNIKKIIPVLLLITAIPISGILTSCKSEKATCEVNKQSKLNKMKKNRSNYGVRYEYKSKAVRKNYVIRNSR